MQALGTDFAIATPAFPRQQAHRVQGCLFVGDVLLNGRHAKPPAHAHDRPQPGARAAGANASRVGLIDHSVVAGASRHPRTHRPTQGRGVARGRGRCGVERRPAAPGPLPSGHTAGHRRLGRGHWPAGQLWRGPLQRAARLPAAQGLQAIVSGSCSVATNQRVMDFIKAGKPAHGHRPAAHCCGRGRSRRSAGLGRRPHRPRPGAGVFHRRASAVRAIQGKLGSEKPGAMVETIAAIARGLVQRGVRQLIVAGGETSGACVQVWASRKCALARRSTPACRGAVPWHPTREGRAASRSSRTISAAHRLFARLLQLQA